MVATPTGRHNRLRTAPPASAPTWYRARFERNAGHELRRPRRTSLIELRELRCRPIGNIGSLILAAATGVHADQAAP